uniref:Serine carboxypeptidase n=1 Tax=Kalanchoe fedtschenkoi TaxID=63787 RepID=A0A7N1A5H7_KALFE
MARVALGHLTALQSIQDCLLQINFHQVMEPLCEFTSQQVEELEWDILAREGRMMESLFTADSNSAIKCREYAYLLSYKWANSPSVRNALGVLPGTVETWNRCPKNFSTYTEDVTTTLSIHKNLSEHTSLRALVYSGDHAISVPHLATEAWIRLLEVPVSDEWRAWYVDGQVAGYQTKYKNDHYSLTYATVKGAGHNAPQYKPEAALALADRFFSFYPI